MVNQNFNPIYANDSKMFADKKYSFIRIIHFENMFLIGKLRYMLYCILYS